MRALLINSVRNTIEEIDCNGENIAEVLGCQNYRLVATLTDNDYLFVDDDCEIGNLPPVACFFLDPDKKPEEGALVAGLGLVTRPDGDVTISVAELTRRILFVWCRYWPDMCGFGIYSSKADALR